MDAPADNPDLDVLLARFPGPLPIYPDRDMVISLLIFAVLGVVVSFLLLLVGFFLGDLFSLVGGIWAGVLALQGTVRYARQLISGRPLVTLEHDGFAAIAAMRTWTVRWGDVQDIQVAPNRLFELAQVNYTASGRPGIMPYLRLPKAQSMSTDELIELMNRWRARAAGGQRAAAGPA
jgi:hypothetical protein